jgi:hypothetical protein
MAVASWRHAYLYVCTDEHAEPVSCCFNLSLTCSIHINKGAHYYLPFLFYFTSPSSFHIKKDAEDGEMLVSVRRVALIRLMSLFVQSLETKPG